MISSLESPQPDDGAADERTLDDPERTDVVHPGLRPTPTPT